MTFQVDVNKLRQARPLGQKQKHSWAVRIFIGIPVAIMFSTVVCAVLFFLIGVLSWIFVYPVMLIVVTWSTLFGRVGELPQEKTK